MMRAMIIESVFFKNDNGDDNFVSMVVIKMVIMTTKMIIRVMTMKTIKESVLC